MATEVYYSLFSNTWSVPATAAVPPSQTYYSNVAYGLNSIASYKDGAKTYYSNPIVRYCIGTSQEMAQYFSMPSEKSCVKMDYYGILEFSIGYVDVFAWGVNKYGTPSEPKNVKVLFTNVKEQ